MPTEATIQAVDEPEGTIYVLCRPGHEPLSAWWPHPLLELEPHAVRLPSITVTNMSNSSIVVSLSRNTEWADPATQERRDEIAQRRRLSALKAWRAARPRRFLATGRKRSRIAFVSEEELREVHSRHWVHFQSLRSISRERWQAWGYASANSCMNSIHEALLAYGLRTHSKEAMTARANRARTKRLRGESKSTYRARSRRESGEIRGVICAGINTGKRRGKPCQMAALDGSDYCFAHDPAKSADRHRILAGARSSRQQ